MNYLQPTDKFYTQLLSDYKAMAKALIQIQREDGFWNPSLVSQDFAGPEFTGTAQFFYGLSWGVNRGILNKKVYMPAINKAWNALKSSIHKDGFIGYVQGSGDRPASSQPIDYNREPDFDDYGLGLFLQGAMEYRKMLLK
jgi:rhamnogalacturonyl hydrolase YesR